MLQDLTYTSHSSKQRNMMESKRMAVQTVSDEYAHLLVGGPLPYISDLRHCRHRRSCTSEVLRFMDVILPQIAHGVWNWSRRQITSDIGAMEHPIIARKFNRCTMDPRAAFCLLYSARA